jgi:3-oxoacyl-[acyl-carrier-protein] synthase-1
MLQPLAVTGIGMVSPVGFNTAQTCAALRAGISKFEEFEGVLDRDGNPLIVSQIPPGGARSAGMEIAIRATREALSPLTEKDRRRVTVSLLASESERPGRFAEIESRADALLAALDLPASTAVHVFPRGNAAGVEALWYAHERIELDPESIECLLGADSLLDMEMLIYLDKADRLKCPAQPRGLIPGEAAACIVLRSGSSAASRGLYPYCAIEGWGWAQEPVPVGSQDPCLGEGLTSAIARSRENAGWNAEEIGAVYCDLNGEIYRAHEWMLALCRTLAHPYVVHPADCIGDVGSASVPLLIGMAGVALHRGYAKSDRILVFCSSDFGSRGSVCLSVAPGAMVRRWK